MSTIFLCTYFNSPKIFSFDKGSQKLYQLLSALFRNRDNDIIYVRCGAAHTRHQRLFGLSYKVIVQFAPSSTNKIKGRPPGASRQTEHPGVICLGRLYYKSGLSGFTIRNNENVGTEFETCTFRFFNSVSQIWKEGRFMSNQNDNVVLLNCSKNDNEELPFDKCITCLMRNAKRCDGPNPLVFKGERRVDFLRKLQQFNKETLRNGSTWSYDYVSAQTEGVSKTTVIRIMSEINYDPGTYAYGEVFRVLFDSSVGEYPCGIHSEEKEVAYVDSPETLKEMERIQQENESIRAELAQLRANIGRAHDFQERELAAVREEARKQAEAQAEAYRADVKEYRELVAHMREQMARKDDYIDRLAKKAGI